MSRSFERAHAYARAAADVDDELDDVAPGRMSRAAQLRSPGRPLLSGLVLRKANGAQAADPLAIEHAIGRAASSAGLALPEALRRKFEASLGADLSAVRLHTGGDSHTAAETIGAKAYTIGQDIHFSGKYDPTSAASELLLAHEVAHTVQQRGGAPVHQNKLEVSSPTDSFEHEADRAADAMVAGTAFAVGAAPVVAARVPDEDSGPGDIQALNQDGFPNGEPTLVYASPDPRSTVLAHLPKGGAIKIIGGNGSYYVVSYDGTKKGYIDYYDLDVDGPASAVDVEPGQAAPAAATQTPGAPADSATSPAASPQTAGQRYRSAITKALDFWKGSVEGGADGKFARFRDATALETARKKAGVEHKVFTTCIDFLGQVQADAARDAHVTQTVTVDNKMSVPEGRKKLPRDAWHPASANMAARPTAGDVLFFAFAKDVKENNGDLKFGKGWFSHVGYFNGIGKLPPAAPVPASAGAGDGKATNAKAGPTDAVELWHTVDGGQGTATKYDAAGNLTTQGHESLLESDRYYHPAQNLISGEKIQGDDDARTLMGWIDVEKLVASEDPPDP